MPAAARVRIDPATGAVEIEGSEAFIRDLLPTVQGMLEGQPKHARASAKPKVVREKDASTKKGGTRARGLQAVKVEIGRSGQTRALAEFLQQKIASPKSEQEYVTSMIYYLIKLRKLDEVAPGQLLYCYNELGRKKPIDMYGVLKNTWQRTGWIQKGNSKGTYRLTIKGENFVEHDLPRKDEK